MIEVQSDLEERPDSGEMEVRAEERLFLALRGSEEEEAHCHCSKSSLIGWKAQAALQQEAETALRRERTSQAATGVPRRGR